MRNHVVNTNVPHPHCILCRVLSNQADYLVFFTYQAYQADQANRLASAQKHQVLAHVCFGNNCADVSPAFVKALIRTEKKTYAKAYTSGEAAERRELVAAKPHQVGDVIDGVRPMRVATLREQVGHHEQEVHGPADEVKAKPLWHSQWMKLFGPKGDGKVNYGQW